MRSFPYFAVALSGLSILSLFNHPAQAKDVDTKTFTPSAIGFTFPEMAARTLGINGVFSGMNTDAIKKELSGDSSKVDVTEDSRGGFQAAVNGVLHAVAVPIPQTTIAANATFRDDHPGTNVSPDQDIQTVYVTVRASTYIERIDFDETWSNRHNLGPPITAVANKLIGTYGQPLIKPTDELKLSYCFNAAGKQIASADCGDNIAIEVEAHTCVDPATAQSLTTSGSPMYNGLICRLRISYADHRVTNAFDQELLKLARQKFVELFGEPDKS